MRKDPRDMTIPELRAAIADEQARTRFALTYREPMPTEERRHYLLGLSELGRRALHPERE